MLANYEGAFFCILAFLLLYLPSWIQVKLRIELPPPLEITIFCFIFAAEILGEVNAFYVVIPGWDTMLHTINGFLAAAVGFSMVMLLNDDERVTFHLSPAYLAMVAFCFSMTIGVLWEFFEFGMDFFLDYNADNFEYFGMGPKENYRDMCRSAKMGRYKSSADGEYVNYIMPQEHGNHTKTKYLKFENSLMFEGDFEFNVSHYGAEMLTEAMHIDELKKSDCTNVRIDYKVSGIGSNSCGPEIAEKYRLDEKNIRF